MANHSSLPGSYKGAVYGDLIGTPYMIENTHNRYFELGESRRAYSHGRVRSFFPEVTEVSHGATAVCHWLSTYRDDPTAENLQKCLRNQYYSHPRGGWTEPTRLFLTHEGGIPSATADWSAVTRCVPIASYFQDDLFRTLDLAEASVRATCADEDTVRMARALTHAVFSARHGSIGAELLTLMEMQYGLNLSRPDDDLREELSGKVRTQLEMMGRPVPGAFHYVMPETPLTPSARLVTEAALRAVIRSDSWEDAVRRAVALGGPSNAVAGIAGGIAEALYGEVTPTIVGKLFPYLPTDIARQIEQNAQSRSIVIDSGKSPYASIQRDALTAILLADGSVTYVVPENRKDIRKVIQRNSPGARIIAPSEEKAFLAPFQDKRSGTYAYGVHPEKRTLYVQDGEYLVSPSQYVAAGMPSLQERRRHLKAFLSLRSWCVDLQGELNERAGNRGAGQVHYGDAFHLWIGSRRIDFPIGDFLAGRIALNERGLLTVDLGDYRDLTQDARFDGHREQSWRSRSVFSVADSADPLGRIEDIKDAIRTRLLDEGLRSGVEREEDPRYLSEDELRDRAPVSNVDHLEALEPGEDTGIPVSQKDTLLPGLADRSSEGKTQPTRTVFSMGYGIRSQDAFINTLQMLDIDTVVDIRSRPKSRFTPEFDEDIIYGALTAEGIDYYSAGEKLGGRVSDPSLLGEDGQVDWDRFRGSPSFQEGIRAIEALSDSGHIVAFVCTEGDPLQCHRMGTVARNLAEDGMDVRHVLLNGEVVSHAEMEDRLLHRYIGRNMVPSVESGSYQRQMDEAYRALNREKGYRPRPSQGTDRKFRKRIK